jgi:hypothetical protein
MSKISLFIASAAALVASCQPPQKERVQPLVTALYQAHKNNHTSAMLDIRDSAVIATLNQKMPQLDPTIKKDYDLKIDPLWNKLYLIPKNKTINRFLQKNKEHSFSYSKKLMIK